jgi:hypothetical protein
MKENGLTPDNVSYNLVLLASIHHRDVSEYFSYNSALEACAKQRDGSFFVARQF